MKKVSRKTWQYKLVNASVFYPARSICGYFWQVVGLCSFIIAAIPTAIAAVIMGPLIVFIGDPVKEWINAQPIVIELWLVLSSVIGILAWGIAIVIGFVFVFAAIGEYGVAPVIKKVHDRYFDDVPAEPGLFKQWVKAKKDKVCPIIEYVD